jgi:hypothetical protein
MVIDHIYLKINYIQYKCIFFFPRLWMFDLFYKIIIIIIIIAVV